MRVNIVGSDNGVGLGADIAILSKLFSDNGIDYSLCPLNKTTDSYADVNLFLEILRPERFKYAKKNVLLVNPEWFIRDWKPMLSMLDAVFCKSRYAQQLFTELGARAVYTSFTSRDRKDSSLSKDYSKWIHVSGKSSFKGTEGVIGTWEQNPDFPALTLIRDPIVANREPRADNIRNFVTRLPDEFLTRMLNIHGIHLCTSSAEGFGHYIWEALSTGAIVITTDAPPMNEFVPDDVGLRVRYSKTRPSAVGRHYVVEPHELTKIVNQILEFDDATRARISSVARRHWEVNDTFFRTKFIQEIKHL